MIYGVQDHITAVDKFRLVRVHIKFPVSKDGELSVISGGDKSRVLALGPIGEIAAQFAFNAGRHGDGGLAKGILSAGRKEHRFQVEHRSRQSSRVSRGLQDGFELDVDAVDSADLRGEIHHGVIRSPGNGAGFHASQHWIDGVGKLLAFMN